MEKGSNYTGSLSHIKLFVLDMDGTFYLGDRPIGGSLEFIEKLEGMGRKYVFFTNNSSRTAAFYKEKLRGMGVRIGEPGVITSGDVTAGYLNRNHPGRKVYLLGTPLLEKDFAGSGIELVDEKPDIVVAAFDTGFTYERICSACRFIREGAVFIATHMDFNCPTENGFIPDCGSMCAMITASTGVKPKFLGKPFRETLDAIKVAFECDYKEMAFIGDRLYTDIAAKKHGAAGILVLSGETRESDLESPEIEPDITVPKLGDLAEYL